MRSTDARLRALTGGLVAACLIATGIASVAAGRVFKPRDDLPRWTLADMGVPGVELPTNELRSEYERTIRLPAGASQGPDTWYLMRLRVEVELDPSTRWGTFYLGGALDGFVSELVRVKVRPRGHSGPRMRWSTVDLIEGSRLGKVEGRTLRLDVMNYVQDGGVAPGRRTLSFDVERGPRVRLARVRILPQSGIIATASAPANLVLEAPEELPMAPPGEWATVDYRLTNDGDRPAHGVHVTGEATEDGVETDPVGTQRVGRLEAGRTFHGTLRVRSRDGGPVGFALRAGGANTNAPLVEFAGTSVPPVPGPP